MYDLTRVSPEVQVLLEHMRVASVDHKIWVALARVVFPEILKSAKDGNDFVWMVIEARVMQGISPVCSYMSEKAPTVPFLCMGLAKECGLTLVSTLQPQ